jgi:type I restriction enzyme S subunit
MSKFKRYERYKDSGVEWIGEIPEHWGVIKLKYVTKLAYGDSLPTENREEEGEVDVFGSNGKVGTHNVANTLSPVIIVGRKGSYGKVTYSDKKCFAIDTTYYIDNRCTKSNIKWLYYSLMVLELDKNSQDTGVPGLSREYAYNKYVPVPTVNEQVAIANFLDQKTAEIDGLIADKEKLIELLQEKRQAVITEAVTKGLNPNVRLKDSEIEWIGEIPEHWSIIKMKYLLSSKKYSIKAGPFGSQLKNDDMVSGDIKVYNQKTVLDNDFKSGDYYIENCKYEELRAFEVFSGDLLVTTRGTIGKTAIVPKDAEKGILHPCLIKITLNPDKVLNDYVNVIFNNTKIVTNQIMLESNATTIDVIYTDTLKNLVLPIPPLEEQKSIIDFVDAKIGEIDGLISSINNQIQKLKEYRQSLISEAVTGKIDVRIFENKDEVIYSEQDSSPCRELTHVAE